VSLVLGEPIIYLITKGEATDSNFSAARAGILDTVRLAVEEKISLIQIREKLLSARLLFDLAVDAAAITRGSETRLLVNDRADIALAAGADGVHLAANSIPTDVIRKTLPPEFIIGVSTHTLVAVEDAAKARADLAVFGPVFETPDKGEAQGLPELAKVCDKVRRFPVLGLGGIDLSNFESVLAAGASGIAAIRSLNDAASLRAMARKFRK